mmetsp:Transcript_10966/g.34854  ORF Transcript_10966/g.34854 Transcript_10966/m.34854 type:complete len:83 (+) Transcript_10966:2033-2281(+)
MSSVPKLPGIEENQWAPSEARAPAAQVDDKDIGALFTELGVQREGNDLNNALRHSTSLTTSPTPVLQTEPLPLRSKKEEGRE